MWTQVRQYLCFLWQMRLKKRYIVEKLVRSTIKKFSPKSWKSRKQRNDLEYSLSNYGKNNKSIKIKIAAMSWFFFYPLDVNLQITVTLNNKSHYCKGKINEGRSKNFWYETQMFKYHMEHSFRQLFSAKLENANEKKKAKCILCNTFSCSHSCLILMEGP